MEGKIVKTIDERLFSRTAEAAVIGSVIINPDCIDKIAQIVGTDSFYFPENKIIFQAILDMREDSTPIDGVTVRNRLEENKQLEEIGGVDYLANILDSIPHSENAEYYSKMVQEKVSRRRFNAAIENIKQLSDSDEPLGECISQVKQIANGLQGAIDGIDSEAVIVNLNDIETKAIHWLWFNKIPCGMFTLIFGNPGLGKSFFSLDMAARISSGSLWPDGDGVPDNRAPQGTVVLLTAEDALDTVVKPRLMSLGADVKNIYALEAVRYRDNDGRQKQSFFSLQDDLPALKRAVRTNTKLIIIDPLSAYFGHGLDTHRDSDIRGVLAPLIDLAEQTGVAVIGVTHLNKNTSGKAVYRALGSIGLIAAARTAWLISEDPNELDSRRRLLVPAKQNILIDPSGLAFEIVDGKVIYEHDPVHTTADEALSGSTVTAPKREFAIEWLRENLTPGKSISSNEIKQQAKKAGITEGTLDAAKREIGVETFPLTQPDGKTSAWFWRLKE